MFNEFLYNFKKRLNSLNIRYDNSNICKSHYIGVLGLIVLIPLISL